VRNVIWRDGLRVLSAARRSKNAAAFMRRTCMSRYQTPGLPGLLVSLRGSDTASFLACDLVQ
jgi:hypothetical protein